MFTFKNCKNVLQLVMWGDFPSFLTWIFYIFCLLHSWQTAIFWDQWDDHPPKHEKWPNAFVSPSVNSREEFVPSSRAYARKGSPRRWLGDYKLYTECHKRMYSFILISASNKYVYAAWHKNSQNYYRTYYIHDKITAIWLVKRSAIISLIALSRSGKSKQQNPIWRRNLDKYF
jgi:hypothetical protein